MHKILINAISVREGGGAVVLTRLLDEMIPLEKDIHWWVVVDESLRSRIPEHTNITVLSFPWVKKSPLHLFYWYAFYLPSLVRREQIDLVFSQSNTLPTRKLSCPTLLLVQHVGYFSKKFATLHLKSKKGVLGKLGWYARAHWVYRSVKRATAVTVQTQALADAMVKQLDITPHKITVIPHGPGLAKGAVAVKKFPQENEWRIGYITKFGVQKNFEVLFQAIRALKQQGIHCKLILTLDTSHAPYQDIQSLIEAYQIADCIENHGEINAEQTRALYQSLALFIFPSLCESFGFTLVEALHYGIPVIAADTPSNREIVGDQGLFFNAHQGTELAEKISRIISDRHQYEAMSKASINRSQHYSWATTSQQMIVLIKELL